MKYFKVGQEAWCLNTYKGLQKVTIKVVDYAGRYPIIVELGDGEQYSFTSDGRYDETAEVSLFQTKPIITPNVPIFEERPAYFCDSNGLWLYDVLVGVSEKRKGQANSTGYWYSKWQYEAPTL